MTRSSSPPIDEAVALELLNRLLAAFGREPLHAVRDDELASELREAYPLLSMLAPKASAEGEKPELLDELCHNWNKAVRRRGWRRLPSIDGRIADAAANAVRVQSFLTLFGVRLRTAECSPETLLDAAALSALLADRVEALRTPPLPGPAKYASELAAVLEAWNALAAQHPGLPRIE